MGVFERLGKSAKAGLADLKSRTFGRSNKPLDQLTDDELEEELLRRRRERAAGRHAGSRREEADSPQRKQLAQCYANLELSPGASLADVKAKYRELMRKYHPDRHVGDPTRHRAATELAQSLTSAYQALVQELGDG